MNSKKWIRAWFIIVIITSIPIVGGLNYVVDPYALNEKNVINKPKIQQRKKMRLIKAMKTERIKPASICLGTSRAEYGYDPAHSYFSNPSYNLATVASSMYENRLYFEHSLKQGKLKKVLLVADYIMFNDDTQKAVQDFETYFEGENIYGLLFSMDVLKDSLLTIIGGEHSSTYSTDGQREQKYHLRIILKDGGHLKAFKKWERKSYKDYQANYTYGDTRKKSFPDFEEIIRLCYENNIELDIIFGPSHIRQWEALNYYFGYGKWLKWKKDVVLSANKIAKQLNKKQFRIMDFSVYHKLTAEKVPTDKNTTMKYYMEASHYRNELGLIVLDRLTGKSEYKDFGVELNLQNINAHLKQQRVKREEYIDVNKYQLEVFGEIKGDVTL